MSIKLKYQLSDLKSLSAEPLHHMMYMHHVKRSVEISH